MTNTGGEAVKRIFVKVFGFDDVERHALNTVFRLSETRHTAYALWTAAAPEEADMALIDGDSWEATLELANPAHDDLKLIWIGDNPPARARLVVKRPLQWAAVIEGMDQLLAADLPQTPGSDLDLDLLSESTALLDLDLDFDSEAPTAPSPLEGPATEPPQQAEVLVVDADRDARLYLRARLAMAGMLLVDEAATGTEALKLMDTRLYKLVILDAGPARHGALGDGQARGGHAAARRIPDPHRQAAVAARCGARLVCRRARQPQQTPASRKTQIPAAQRAR